VKPKNEIRSHVREFRARAGLTQEDLATRIGVTRQTILSIEKGNYTPSVALALRLADVLGARVEELFDLGEGGSDA
jgi:putative transcriptional regulator